MTTPTEAIKTLENLIEEEHSAIRCLDEHGEDFAQDRDMHLSYVDALTLAITALKGEATRLPKAVKAELSTGVLILKLIVPAPESGDRGLAYYTASFRKSDSKLGVANTPEAAIDALALELERK